MRRFFTRQIVPQLLIFTISVGVLQAAETAKLDTAKLDTDKRDAAITKSIAYLQSKGQAENGSFTAAAGPAITGLCVTALVQAGVPVEDPSVQKGLRYLEKFVRADGGIHAEGTLYRNYETCVAILCFSAVNKNGKYDKVIKKADGFVKGLQWVKDEDGDPFAPGGAGYGKHKRPDLSNTTFFVEALRTSGNAADSEAIQRALVFISQSQNLESEHNKTPFSTKNPDGGFYYTPAAGGSSQAGLTENGGLRSYASMTYAGLKSMIFAGVGPDDKRVKAAMGWISKNYDLTSNPGLGDAGQYYYYHTFAKALAAMKVDELTDEKGVVHNWRADLVNELAKRQRSDGSFVNKNARWLEGDANLVTAYSLLALSYCK